MKLIVASAFLVVMLMLKSKQNRNVRNNNPLNIRFNPRNDWVGQTGQSGGFAVFKSPEFGFRAAYKLINRYLNEFGLSSIEEVVSRWAPEEDGNDESVYAEYLAKKLNKFTFSPIFAYEIPDLLLYMAKFEGARNAYTIEQVNEGIKLA